MGVTHHTIDPPTPGEPYVYAAISLLIVIGVIVASVVGWI